MQEEEGVDGGTTLSLNGVGVVGGMKRRKMAARRAVYSRSPEEFGSFSLHLIVRATLYL